MDQAKMQDMAKIMGQMSATMQEMSEQMAKGQSDPALMKSMQERMDERGQSDDGRNGVTTAQECMSFCVGI